MPHTVLPHPLRCLATLAALVLLAIGPAQAARQALVIGNSAYADSPLKNPVNDARAMDAKLRGLGFEVQKVENLKRTQIGRTLSGFAARIRPGDEVVVFYAGHGLQVKGVNYLPAVDAEIHGEDDVPLNSLNLSALLDRLDEAKAGVKLLFLDACPNNPYARGFRTTARGLARVADAPSGTLMHFATRPGSVAADGSGANGLYTTELLKAIDQPGMPIEQMLKRVAAAVERASQGQQEPWVEGSLKGDFYFRAGGAAPNPVATVLPEPAVPPQTSARPVASVISDKVCAECPTTVLLPAGSFQMGSPDGEAERKGREGPVHSVRIGQRFVVAKHAVTRGEFAAFVNATGYRTETEQVAGCFGWTGSQWEKSARFNWRQPGFEQGDDHPVVCVSWNDAQKYIGWLNGRSFVKGWRLLTEAEFEYAARGRSSTPYSWGPQASHEQANYGQDSCCGPLAKGRDRWNFTAPGGSFPANSFGLHDMLGNVWQWVQDVWHDNYNGAPSDGSAWLSSGGQSRRVLRGGGWDDDSGGVRSAERNWSAPDGGGSNVGFRLARTVF